MRIIDILKRENVHVHLKPAAKEELLEELVGLLLADRPEEQRREALREVRLREEIGSTGIGEGVAIPHAKATFCDGLMACLGIADDPVPFDAIDGQPVRIFMLVIGPRDQAGRHLRFLARAARLLKKRERREALLAAVDADEAYRVVDMFEKDQIDA
jgi:PTS system nitrogen regulatory IIA component